RCKGRWIKSFQYWRWQAAHGQNLPEVPADEAPATPVSDSAGAKLCPECGRILTRYRVGRGRDFCVDRCGHCAGVWFDGIEWVALRARNLHDEVHFVVSSGWEARGRKEASQRRHDQLMGKKLGDADFTESGRIKAWIDAHPERDELYAILLHRGEVDA